MSVYHPVQVTEREPDGSYEDCTWCTGVMLRNAHAARTVAPATRTEYEALRVAGGDGPAENPGDGSNYGQMADGMERRYGVRPTVMRNLTFDQAWALFEPGIAMAWQGSMGEVGTYLRRWDPGFGVGGKLAPHSALAIRDDRRDRAWWMNPLAPASFPGEYVTKTTLKNYFEGLDQATRAIAYLRVGIPAPDTATEEPMPKFVNVNGYAVDSNRRIHAVDGDKWLYLDGSPGGTINTDADGVDLIVVGTSDSVPNQYVVVLGTGTPYPNDDIVRDTLILLRTTRPTFGYVAPPPDCSPAVKRALGEALDHIAGPYGALGTAIEEARPR